MPRRAARREALLAMVALLSPKTKAAAAATRIALVFDDPAAYAKRYRADLDARSVEEPDDDYPWTALVDVLLAANALASIDWKWSFDELTWSLDQVLPKKASRWAWAKKRADLEARSTLELLEIVGERLMLDEGLVLAQLELPADEHELVVVPKKDVARLVALGKRASYGRVDLFTGSELARFERERLAKEAEASAAKAKDPTRQRQLVHPDGRVFVTWGQQWRAEKKKHYAINTIEGALGVDLEQLLKIRQCHTSTDRKEIARRREKEIAARLAGGFVEVSGEEWVKRSAAAKRARRPKRKK